MRPQISQRFQQHSSFHSSSASSSSWTSAGRNVGKLAMVCGSLLPAGVQQSVGGNSFMACDVDGEFTAANVLGESNWERFDMNRVDAVAAQLRQLVDDTEKESAREHFLNQLRAADNASTAATAPASQTAGKTRVRKRTQTTEEKAAEAAAEAKGVKISRDLRMFLSPRELKENIELHGGERKFALILMKFAQNPSFVRQMQQLPIDARMSVAETNANILRWDEKTMALPIERSDVDADERRRRMQNNSPGGKTGAFVLIFRRLLTWIHGEDLKEMAEKEGRRRLLETEEAIARGEDPATLDQDIVRQLNAVRANKEKDLPGSDFVCGATDGDAPEYVPDPLEELTSVIDPKAVTEPTFF